MFIEQHAAELPPSGSVHADEGTLAHDKAKELLLKRVAVFDDGNEEMQRHVNSYCNFVQSKIRPGATVYIEERVPLFYDLASSGTVDAAIIDDSRIDICDLKYGAGVSVYAEKNKQLAIYAMSLIAQHPTPMNVNTPVGLYIFQPRDRNDPEPVRSWELTYGELIKFCEDEIVSAVNQINAGKVVFKPQPETVCRWCPAKGICKSYAVYGLEAVPEVVHVMSMEPALPDPNALTREQRIRVIRARKALEQWLEAVEDQEVAELSNGAQPAGYKLVEGKSNRAWADEEAALGLLRRFVPLDQLRPPAKLVSPAQAEKLLAGKTMTKRFVNRWNSLITKPQGKPTLVPETDKRPALDLNPTKMLDAQDVI